MRTASSMFEQFTLGIEEEFQIVDPQTRELGSHVSEILDEGKSNDLGTIVVRGDNVVIISPPPK